MSPTGSTGALRRVPIAALGLVMALAAAVVVFIVVLLPARPENAPPAGGDVPTSTVRWEPDPCRSAMRGPC